MTTRPERHLPDVFGTNNRLLILANSAELMLEPQGCSFPGKDGIFKGSYTTDPKAHRLEENAGDSVAIDKAGSQNGGLEHEPTGPWLSQNQEQDNVQNKPSAPRSEVRREGVRAREDGNEEGRGNATRQKGSIRLTQIRRQARSKCGSSGRKPQGKVIRLTEIRRQARNKHNLVLQKAAEEHMQKQSNWQMREI